MRKITKFLATVCAFMLVACSISTVSAANFVDVPESDKALSDAVDLLDAVGITKGTSSTTFGTNENVTRQQMAAFVYRLFNAGRSMEGGQNYTAFTDLEDPTYFTMISWANTKGIIRGTSKTTFEPFGGITLQDAYTMLVRALGYEDNTYTYPLSYISKAEDLGLGENLEEVPYDKMLQRGEVAILLANTFYAETADVVSKNKSLGVVFYKDGEVVPAGTAGSTPISLGTTPEEVHETVAEKIFDVKKIAQRVVATPNLLYKFNSKVARPDEDEDMVYLTATGVVDYAEFFEEGDEIIEDLGEREFSELGLAGKPDDYFMSDILMFVRETKDGEYDILGATAQGKITTVSFDTISFGTITGSTADKYYDKDKEYKKFNGCLDINGVKAYLYDAPYSFTKSTTNTNKYNSQFIEIVGGATKTELEDDETYLEFAPVTVALDDSVLGEYDETNEQWVGDGYLSQIYLGGLGEVDCFDCNGDGKYEYLFVKNYTVATVNTDEDCSVGDNFDITDADIENLFLYTDKTMVDGIKVKDKDVVLAYVSEAGNYAKIAEVLKAETASHVSYSENWYKISTGKTVYFENANAVTTNADLCDNGKQFGVQYNPNTDSQYYFAKNGKLVYTTSMTNTVSIDTNWVIVVEDTTTTGTVMEGNKLKAAEYVTVYNDGEVKSVKARDIATSDKYYDAVVTPEVDLDDAAPFTAYLDKLATAKSDKNGAYYFKMIDDTDPDLNDIANVQAKDENGQFYAHLTNTTFDKVSGKNFEVGALKSAYGINWVTVKPYTQIIIKSVDKDDASENVINTYDYNNLPSIKEGTKFAKAEIVLGNNINSTKYENLIVFYGVLEEVLKNSNGATAEVRFVRDYSTQTIDDSTIRTYSLYNPFTGGIEKNVDGITDGEALAEAGDIISITTEGFVEDDVVGAQGNIFSLGIIYDTDNSAKADFDEYKDEVNEIGYVEVENFDKNDGYLSIVEDDTLYVFTDETVVTLIDQSEKSIKTVDASVLDSTSATYRFNNEKTGEISVVLCVEDDDDDDNDLFKNVVFCAIVRQ